MTRLAYLIVGTILGAITTLTAPTLAGGGYGDWQPIPGHMVGDQCDTIDGGSPTITLGNQALYHDTAGTRYVITVQGRICAS
jgi:hypothetical protein